MNASSANTVLADCPICLDSINLTNSTITPCGHRFCFQCIFKSTNKKAASFNKCPCCRAVLDESMEEEDEDDDEEDEDDDEYDEEFEKNDLSMYDMDEILERFVKKGYTFKDALIISTGNTDNIKNYTEEYIEKISNDFNTIIDDLCDENYELFLMRNEDKK